MAKWAVIGAGEVAQRHVAPGLLAAGQEIAALWAPRAEQRLAVATRFETYAASNAAEAIELADAVYVCSPADSHVHWALQAIARGRHVLVEKPFNLELADAAALRDALMARPDLAFRVAYYRRFWPLIIELRKLVVAQKFGRLRSVRCDFAQPYLPLASRPNWRLDPQRAGGGVIADAGCHRLDYLIALLGWPTQTGIEDAHRHGEQVETEVVLRLAWPGDVSGQMRLSWLDDSRDLLELTFEDAVVGWTGSRPGSLVVTLADAAHDMPIEHPQSPLEPMLRHFDGAMKRCREGINPVERHAVVADAWKFDALLTDLVKRALQDSGLAVR